MPRRPQPAPPVSVPADGPATIPLQGAPWYVKLVIWLLVWFGFPVFMCVIFLMLLVGYIPSPLTRLSDDMRDHKEEMRKVLEFVATSTRVNRQMCRNTATNPVERSECDR